jgi:hypothetical protein
MTMTIIGFVSVAYAAKKFIDARASMKRDFRTPKF